MLFIQGSQGSNIHTAVKAAPDLSGQTERTTVATIGRPQRGDLLSVCQQLGDLWPPSLVEQTNAVPIKEEPFSANTSPLTGDAGQLDLRLPGAFVPTHLCLSFFNPPLKLKSLFLLSPPELPLTSLLSFTVRKLGSRPGV